MSAAERRPRIVAFVCHWCAYAGADLAGVSRIQYDPNVVLIRVMCTGSIAPQFLLKAFQKGADGVLVAGCHPGECHYQTGNEMAQKRVAVVKEALDIVGLAPDQLRLEWVSAAEGARFAEIVNDFAERIADESRGPADDLGDGQ